MCSLHALCKLFECQLPGSLNKAWEAGATTHRNAPCPSLQDFCRLPLRLHEPLKLLLASAAPGSRNSMVVKLHDALVMSMVLTSNKRGRQRIKIALGCSNQFASHAMRRPLCPLRNGVPTSEPLKVTDKFEQIQMTPGKDARVGVVKVHDALRTAKVQLRRGHVQQVC